jgi:hypothetical protein
VELEYDGFVSQRELLSCDAASGTVFCSSVYVHRVISAEVTELCCQVGISPAFYPGDLMLKLAMYASERRTFIASTHKEKQH